MTDSAKQGRVLIVGATSAIAEAVARLYAVKGCKLCLVGRRADALQRLAADLRVRGAVEVAVEILDATQFDAHADCLTASWSRWN
jgi:short-subunit dehydrogenase